MGPTQAPTRRRRAPGLDRPGIVDAALRLVAAKGARAWTAKALGAALGTSDAALFRYFPTMEAMADAMVERVEELLFAEFPPEDPDPLARLGAFFRRRVRTIVENPHVSRLLWMPEDLGRAAGPRGAAKLRGFRLRSRRFVLECLDEARASGRLTGVTVDEAAVLVLGAVMALAHSPALSAGPGRVTKLADGVWTALEALFRGDGGTGGRGRPGPRT